jgi:hypothetical protein
MEQRLEQSLEPVWSWFDFAIVGYEATAGASIRAGLDRQI